MMDFNKKSFSRCMDIRSNLLEDGFHGLVNFTDILLLISVAGQIFSPNITELYKSVENRK